MTRVAAPVGTNLVPALVGLPLERARAALALVGLEAPEVYFAESYQPQGTVLTQRPEPGPQPAQARVVLEVSRRGCVELLPMVLRRPDPDGGSLVRAFCQVLEHLVGPVDDLLDHAHALYDPRSCPAAVLPWLAGWLGLALDPALPEARRRTLVARAAELYQRRGTAAGLALAIELVTGVRPIVEDGRRPDGEPRVGTTRVAERRRTSGCELAVTVWLPCRRDEVDPGLVAQIHEVARREAPAHLECWVGFATVAAPGAPSDGLAIGLRSGIALGHERAGREAEEDGDGER